MAARKAVDSWVCMGFMDPGLRVTNFDAKSQRTQRNAKAEYRLDTEFFRLKFASSNAPDRVQALLQWLWASPDSS